MTAARETLVSRIEAVAERGVGSITFVSGDEHETASWTTLHLEARAVAARLQAEGIGP